MNVVIFGMNDYEYDLESAEDYQILMYIDNDFRRCKEGYHGYKVIHPIELCNYKYDIIILNDDVNQQIGAYNIFEKIMQLTIYEVDCNKIYGFKNGTLVPYHILKDVMDSRNSLSYEKIFKVVHSKSILNTHIEYVLERCKGRKLYIYGIGYEAICLTKMLNTLNIQVERYITDNKIAIHLKDVNIMELIDLVYEKPDELFVLVADESESYGVTRRKLLNMGIREDIDFTYHTEIPGTDEPFYYDVTLSYSRVRDKIEGFELFGDIENKDAINIAVLGGSTTESQLFFIKGWVPFFAEYMHLADIPTKIYCGGVSGYTSTQELLKFERDVLSLSPDIVISYSGVNDLYMFPMENEKERFQKPFITKFQVQFIKQVLEKLNYLQYGFPTPDISEWEKGGKPTVFYGLNNEKSAASFWIDNMRMINALSKEFGIAFFSFFQPFRFNGYYKSTPTQEIIHSRRDPSCNPPSEGEILYGRKKEFEELRKYIQKYNFITDLSELFIGESDIYYDSVHVYEKGNQIIARRICDVITNYIRSKGE